MMRQYLKLSPCSPSSTRQNYGIKKLSQSAATSLLCCIIALGLAGCDLIDADSGNGDLDDVPPERLMTMVAVYDNGENPAHRLIVADFENPSKYKVLRKAGDEVSGTCFAPGKRRILFADQEGSVVGTRSHLKLYNLETNEVRALDAPMAATYDGSLDCTWRADGSGFYYSAGGAAGLAIPVYYDLQKATANSFEVASFHGRKGSDSLLVNVGTRFGPVGEGSTFHFIDAFTGEVLERVENEYLRFKPWKDSSRGGYKQAAYHVAYSNATSLVAFERRKEGEISLATTDLEGDFLKKHSLQGVVRCVRWAGKHRILFDHRPNFGSPWSAIRVMEWDTETNEVQELIAPEHIDGAVGLHLPDY